MSSRLPHLACVLVAGLLVGQDPGGLKDDPIQAGAPGSLPVEGPRALTPAGKNNLVAFARAYGYMRFFQPTDAALKVDWDALAIQGVRAVEGARSPKDLAARLQTFFAPYAPTAYFLAPGELPAAPLAPKGATQVVRWRHKGFGQGKPGPYASIREYADLEALPAGWRRPDQPLVKALGRGVRVQFAPTLYADAAKVTLPMATRAQRHDLPRLTGSDATNPNDRAIRLAGAVVAWNAFEHFYPYREESGTDWAAELPRVLGAQAEAKDNDAAYIALLRLNAALHDGHGAVRGPGEQEGQSLPVRLHLIDGKVYIAASKLTGLPAGSEILAIDGESMTDCIARLKPVISASSESRMNSELAHALRDAGKGPKAKIRLRTPVGEASVIEVARHYDPNLRWWGFPENSAELNPGIWYVDLARVTDDDFTAILPKLASAKGVVFDLRGYPHCRLGFFQHLTD